MRMGDWSSDVCSSDLDKARGAIVPAAVIAPVISAIDAVAIAEAAPAIIAPVAIIAVGVIAAIARTGPVIVIAAPPPPVARSDDRPGGQACVSTRRSRGAPCH